MSRIISAKTFTNLTRRTSRNFVTPGIFNLGLVTRTPTLAYKRSYSASNGSALGTSSKRAATSLAQTTKVFKNNTPKLELNIIDKKYADDGQLLRLDISENAIKKLNLIAGDEDNTDVALRIGVESGGCHGFQYNLELSNVNTKTEDDCIFEKGGAKVIIDDSSLSILRESTVDYTNELIGSMFKVVDSPYTTSSCGCGSSFDFDFDKLSSSS